MKSGRGADRIRLFQNIVLGLAVFGRIALASLLGLWYPLNELLDDRLMITYADLLLHVSTPDVNSLVKYMGYPLLLNFVHLTGMTYPLFVSGLWILGAALFTRYLKLLCGRRWFLILSFLFLLYTPAAFDLWCGTRLYRNAVIAPLVLITFSLALLLLEGLRRPESCSVGKKILLSTGLGLSLVVTYYQKEDGIWILACLLVFAVWEIAGEVVRVFIRGRKEREASRTEGRSVDLSSANADSGVSEFREGTKSEGSAVKADAGSGDAAFGEGQGRGKSHPWKRFAAAHILLAILPFIIFCGATFAYKAINLRFFGVFETETRTGGEIGRFTSKLYVIESPDRTATLWVPFDAIRKAFAESGTLSAYPELLAGLTNPHPEGSAENVTEKGILGDFITWRLRTELLVNKIWTNEADMQSLFANVNRELDEAFAAGRLKKDGRIRISGSGGGRTPEEIFGLVPEMLAAAGTIVNLDTYEPGGQPELVATGDSSAEIATTLTGVNLVDRDGSTLNIREPIWMNHIVKVLFAVYPHVNRILSGAALAGLLMAVVLFFRAKKRPFPGWDRPANARFAGAQLLLLGFFAAYLLAISWFCEFIWTANAYDNKYLKFYGVGGVPLFAMAALIGAGLLIEGVIGVTLMK